jgi:hypothetical protein
LREPVPSASSIAFHHGSLKGEGVDDQPVACETTSIAKLQDTALLSKIPRICSTSSDQNITEERTSPRPHRNQPTNSGDLLPNAMDKQLAEKLLLCTPAQLHVQLRPANPVERASERPRPLWKPLEVLFTTERTKGKKKCTFYLI